MQYEMIDFSAHMPVRCVMHRLGYIEQHLHNHFELLFVLNGSCTALVGGHPVSLRAEDILTIDGHVPHELRGVDCSVISVQFDPSLFERTLPEPKHPSFDCSSAEQGNNAAFDHLRRLIARLVKNNVEQQEGYPLRNWALVYELMDELYNNFRVDASEQQEAKAHRYAARIAKITSIINSRYTESFTLTELAGQVHLSAPYLSKFFEQQFGMTFLAYLTKVRLNHALKELLYTENTVKNISEHSGFPNSHAFVQAFRKEYGSLPSVYRRDFQRNEQPQSAVEQHDYMASLKKYLDPAVNTASAEQAIVCSGACSAAAPIQQLRHSWRFLLNVGRAADLLYADVQDMARRTQRDIGFSYIKLSGILSDELHICSRNAAGELTYSFTYLDKVLDFLRDVGLRPLVQFSFMPAALAKDPNKLLFGHQVSEPRDMDEWVSLVETVIRHMQDRYGAAEIRRWLFCVWTQPDTPRYMYGFSSDQAFYQFYQRTYLTVKGCDSGLTFGASAAYYIVKPNHTNWYLPFLTWSQTSGCEPDFLNFTYYDTILVDTFQEGQSGKEAFGFVGSMQLNQASDGFLRFVGQVLDEAKRLGWNRPVYLTEWNSTPSQQDLLNDTCFKSCYIARCILESYDQLDSFGYWSLTDWMSEAPLPKQLFFGGLGMFTVNGIPKASYHVFHMLRRLGDSLLGRGPGWFITAGDGGYQVLLYNYRHFSYLYALGERFDMTFTERYTPFSPEQAMDAHLRIENVENGEYLVQEMILNRRHGSAFDIWLSMGGLEMENQEEADYLKTRSTPARRKFTVEVHQHTLELDAWLDMLEVRLLLIHKK